MNWRWLALPVLVAAVAVALVSETQNGPIVFENVVASSRITFHMNNSATPERHQPETMIAGLALFDYNNDGLLDIYFVNGAHLPDMDKSDPKFWNRLYRNNGDGTFTDVTEKAGVRGEGFAMGAAAADYDNDGYVDLYVTGLNRNHLFHNNGDGTFSDVTTKAGVAGIDKTLGKTWAISAGWFDYDNDGLLDLFLVDYVRWNLATEPPCRVGGVRAYCAPENYEGEPNMLFHNNGDGTFTDVSERSAIGKYAGKGMGVAFADYDGDGFTDVFVSNDTYRNFLFHNERNGTFTEVGMQSGVALNENGKSIAGMGTDFRDIDNDGLPDIFVVGMIGDTFPLFRNRGREFADITSRSGVAAATSRVTGWGSGIADFDNDGRKDIFAACASILDNSEEIDHVPAKQPNLLLRNASNLRFANVSVSAGPTFQVPAAHRGAAFGDLNNDGKMDVVVVTQNALPEVFLNRSPGGNHWLMLKLEGTRSNRDGLGAKVKVTPNGGSPIYNHVTTSVGYSASSDKRVHFGLGAADRAVEIEITWPSGTRQVLKDVKADQLLTVREPK